MCSSRGFEAFVLKFTVSLLSLSWIFSSLPVNKQMLALSATYPESLAQYLTRYMNEPTFVRLNPGDMGLKGKTQKLSRVSYEVRPSFRDSGLSVSFILSFLFPT